MHLLLSHQDNRRRERVSGYLSANEVVFGYWSLHLWCLLWICWLFGILDGGLRGSWGEERNSRIAMLRGEKDLLGTLGTALSTLALGMQSGIDCERTY